VRLVLVPKDTRARHQHLAQQLGRSCQVEHLVPRTRFVLALTLAALAFAPTAAFGGPLKPKPKPDAARVRTLMETLKIDFDEKRRKAAADELGAADPRQFPEVATALTTALQKDASASVRAEAAQSLGQLDQVFPMAGVALEGAAAGDSSPLVRLAAKHALWDYHLNGYRSPKGFDGAAAQTVEPPIAAPAGPRPVVALVPAPPPPTAPLIPAAAPVLPPVAPPVSRAASSPLALPIGPRIFRPALLADLVPSNLRPAPRPSPISGPPPILNITGEPPLAKRPAVALPFPPPPTSSVPPPVAVPPPPSMPRAPDYVPTLPPFRPDLPSVVLPPDATPYVPLPPPRIPATLPPR
jgi:hypothetical protein